MFQCTLKTESECFSYWEAGGWCYRRRKIGVLFYFGSDVVLSHC